MGVFTDIGARKMGFKRNSNDLIGARYMIEMTMWLLGKLMSNIHLELLKSDCSLDEQCKGKIHESLSSLSDAWRSIQWVMRATEIGDGKGMRLETQGVVHRTNLEMEKSKTEV